MIIKNIQSNNFLKYENLKLENLPDQGLITISGQNESGKTSIGETLCFALFGRTFTLDLSDPRKLIRWGASQCSVGLTFTVSSIETDNNETYTVERYLDNEGTYGAKLARDSDGATLAKGPEKVSSRILELINFGYNEFVESFYLAQRELTTPHPHSQTIKVMAGIAPLSNVLKQIASTTDDDDAQLDHLKNDFDEVDSSYTELALDADWMPELETSLAATAQEIESRNELNEKLLAGSKSYNTALPIIQKKKRNKSWATFFGLIFFLITLVCWAAWFLLTQEPLSEIATNIDSWIQSQFSQEPLIQSQLTNTQQYQQWLLPAAIISSILLLLNLVSSIKNTGKLRTAQQEAAAFSTSLAAVNNHSDYKYTERVSEFLLQQRQAGDFPANEENTLNLEESDLITRSQSFHVSTDESSKITTEIMNAQSQKIEDASNHKQILERAVSEEQKRLDTGSEFTDIMNSLESRTQELSHLLEVKNTAVELLESAGHHLSHEFNQSILKLAGDALPSFTQGRYKHLKIDDTMDVRVFSSEKGDFLDLDEVSSGTQRQIMLSLRLAMSQALINAIECSPQFIFLDEPFAFFDQERIRDTMAALPSFSKDIKQIWLVAQEFPDAINTDLHIECRRNEPELTFNN